MPKLSFFCLQPFRLVVAFWCWLVVFPCVMCGDVVTSGSKREADAFIPSFADASMYIYLKEKSGMEHPLWPNLRVESLYPPAFQMGPALCALREFSPLSIGAKSFAGWRDTRRSQCVGRPSQPFLVKHMAIRR